MGEEHLQLLKQAVDEFQRVPAARLRGIVLLAFFGLCAGLAVLLSLFDWRLTIGVIGTAAMTAAAYFVIDGLRRDSPLWVKFRELMWNSRVSDRAVWSLGALLSVLLLWLLIGLWIPVFGTVAGVLFAWGFHLAVDQRAERERRSAVDRVADMLRSLRLQGIAEESLRDFVARYSGDGWEEFYETLFGYEAKLAARRRWESEPAAKRTPRFRAWRDPLVAALEARLARLRMAREQRHLRNVEQQALQAQGLDADRATAQAEHLAASMVNQAVVARRDVGRAAPTPADPRAAAAEKRERIKRMLAEARSEAKPRRRTLAEILEASPLGLGMNLEVTYRGGSPLAAYLYLPRQEGDRDSQRRPDAVPSAAGRRKLIPLTGSCCRCRRTRIVTTGNQSSTPSHRWTLLSPTRLATLNTSAFGCSDGSHLMRPVKEATSGIVTGHVQQMPVFGDTNRRQNMIDSKCFSVEQRDDVTILRFADTKDFDTDDYAELQQNLLEFTERQQPAKLLVDLGNVVYCSTALINALLMAQKRIQAWSGTMKLFGVGEVVLETLQRLKLIDKIFSVHADETAASNAS